ncbi:hypothetical protein AB7M49_006979 [Bradyrhizobium elkanii]
MSDLFWDIATSGWVLAAIVAVLVAAFIVSHVPSIVVRFWPTVAAYSKAASLVQVIAAALLFFLIGFRVSDERAETRQLKNDLAFTETQIENAKATAKDAERLKAEAEAKADEAKGQLDDFRAHLKTDPPADCGWTDDEFGRLRNLGRSKRR